MPKAKGVLVTAGAQGSAYAFKGAGGKIDLTGRVPVLKVRGQARSTCKPGLTSGLSDLTLACAPNFQQTTQVP